MKETSRTAAFVGVAVALSALAGITWNAHRPPAPTSASDEGSELFGALDSSRLAPESLEVTALDDRGQPRDFIVRRKDGLWTIPSHYGYPAEAVERLARTATALIGLRRQGLVSRLAADQEKYAVVDPRNPGSSDPESVGKRVTIKGAGDVVLADLIVGRKVEKQPEEPGRPATGRVPADSFYVRVADETSIYRMPLELDLSTRFTDWIQPDLIDLSETTALRVHTDRYQIEEEKNSLGMTVAMTKLQGDQLRLHRASGASPWEMDGLNRETERLKSFEADDLVRTIDGLQIRGVRPKFTFRGRQLIDADLKLNLDESMRQDPETLQRAILRLQGELAARGFTVMPKEERSLDLTVYAEFGEIEMGTEQGVVYTLYFGRPVEGDEESIEVGTPARDLAEGGDSAPPSSAPGNQDASGQESPQPDPAADGANSADSATKEGETKAENRYLLVRVWLDESLLPEPPVPPDEPVAPVPPEGYQPPGGPDGEQALGAPPAAEASGETPQDPAADRPAASGETPRDPAWLEYDQKKGEYDAAKLKYEFDKTRYDEAVRERDEKLKTAREKVAELNERFGQWYYVVSSSNLEKLRPKRDALVEPLKQDAATPPADSLPPVPDIDFGDQE